MASTLSVGGGQACGSLALGLPRSGSNQGESVSHVVGEGDRYVMINCKHFPNKMDLTRPVSPKKVRRRRKKRRGMYMVESKCQTVLEVSSSSEYSSGLPYELNDSSRNSGDATSAVQIGVAVAVSFNGEGGAVDTANDEVILR